jgi:hypothetical protein
MDDPYMWLAFWAGRCAARTGGRYADCQYKDRLLMTAWRQGWRVEFFHPFVQELEGIDVQ